MNLVNLKDLIYSSFGLAEIANSFFWGDPYEEWNNRGVQYISICAGYEGSVVDENFVTHNFIFYAADRLIEGEGNRAQCFDTAINAIEVGLNFCKQDDNLIIEGPRNYTPFRQNFADHLAGVYTRVSFQLPNTIANCTD